MEYLPELAEINLQLCNTMRAYWKGDGGLVSEWLLLTGCYLYAHDGDGLAISNFITCHGGFTLRSVSYNPRIQRAKEDNRDGENHNLS